MIESNGKVLCILCRTSSVKRHFKTIHSGVAKLGETERRVSRREIKGQS